MNPSLLLTLISRGIGLLLVALLLVAGGVALLAFWPFKMIEVKVDARPIVDHEEAVHLIAELRKLAPESIRPECRGIVMDHGRKTKDVYVLLHGLTNCPEQFREFGEILFQRGDNVLIQRTPYHGFLEEYEAEQKLLTWAEMLESANFAIDVAHAFGDRITVVGLSVNGATTAWFAQTRDDVDRAVVIAPFLAPAGVDQKWILPLGRLIYRLPNSLVWWDRNLKEQLQGPSYSYPQFATHPIAHVMRIGLDVVDRAENEAPKAGKVMMVTSASDVAVSLEQAAHLEALWKGKAPDRVSSYQFPKEDQIPHDCIDPHQPGARIDLVYPKLIELIDGM